MNLIRDKQHNESSIPNSTSNDISNLPDTINSTTTKYLINIVKSVIYSTLRHITSSSYLSNIQMK